MAESNVTNVTQLANSLQQFPDRQHVVAYPAIPDVHPGYQGYSVNMPPANVVPQPLMMQHPKSTDFVPTTQISYVPPETVLNRDITWPAHHIDVERVDNVKIKTRSRSKCLKIVSAIFIALIVVAVGIGVGLSRRRHMKISPINPTNEEFSCEKWIDSYGSENLGEATVIDELTTLSSALYIDTDDQAMMIQELFAESSNPNFFATLYGTIANEFDEERALQVVSFLETLDWGSAVHRGSDLTETQDLQRALYLASLILNIDAQNHVDMLHALFDAADEEGFLPSLLDDIASLLGPDSERTHTYIAILSDIPWEEGQSFDWDHVQEEEEDIQSALTQIYLSTLELQSNPVDNLLDIFTAVAHKLNISTDNTTVMLETLINRTFEEGFVLAMRTHIGSLYNERDTAAICYFLRNVNWTAAREIEWQNYRDDWDVVEIFRNLSIKHVTATEALEFLTDAATALDIGAGNTQQMLDALFSIPEDNNDFLDSLLGEINTQLDYDQAMQTSDFLISFDWNGAQALDWEHTDNFSDVEYMLEHLMYTSYDGNSYYYSGDHIYNGYYRQNTPSWLSWTTTTVRDTGDEVPTTTWYASSSTTSRSTASTDTESSLQMNWRIAATNAMRSSSASIPICF